MIRWVLRKAIDKFERDWKYDASYMRDIIDASPRAAWLFSRAAALGQFRRDVPIEPWYAAGITAVRHEDCGPCTQLGVTMAERAGVSPAVLRAVLADNPDAMPPDVALVWKFTRATLAHDAAADEYREAIVKRWGRLRPCQSGFRHHRGANLSDRQVRLGPRQGLHARRRWRHAGAVRSRPGSGAGGCGGAHDVSSAERDVESGRELRAVPPPPARSRIPHAWVDG